MNLTLRISKPYEECDLNFVLHKYLSFSGFEFEWGTICSGKQQQYRDLRKGTGV